MSENGFFSSDEMTSDIFFFAKSGSPLVGSNPF